MLRLLVTGPRAARFEESPIPPCPPDGLLVRARLTAISPGTELRVFRAQPVDDAGQFLHERVPFELPAWNGYSMVGDVLETGPNVTGFQAGDRVFCPAPHQQIATIPGTLATVLPPEIADDQAVWLSVAEVAHIALRRGKSNPGENVAIIGQGVIGLSALAYARAYGFRTAVLDPDTDRLALSRRLGADLAISPRETSCADQVRQLFDGIGADLILEAASRWEAVRMAFDLAAPEARVVAVSRHLSRPDFNLLGHPYLGKALTLITSYGHPAPGQRWDRYRSIALSLDLIRRGRLPLDQLITHRFPWHALPEAYQRLDAAEPGMIGVVLDWRDATH